MVLLRLALRPDLRLAVAALGAAAAMLLPGLGGLVAAGLDVRVGAGEIAYGRDGQPLPEGFAAGADLAVAFEEAPQGTLAAYVVGAADDPGLAADEALPMPEHEGEPPAGLRLRAAPRQPLPLLPPDVLLVHPDRLDDAAADLAYFANGTSAAPDGVVVAPARGTDGFEARGVAGLRSALLLLLAASVPAVALVAATFAGHEVRERARSAAVLAALGRPGLGRILLAVRAAWMSLLAGIVAAGALALVPFGLPALWPADPPWGLLATSLALPTLAAAVAGVAVVAVRARPMSLLRAPPGADPPGPRLAWLPPLARPLLLGVRLLPVLALAALLFAVDVGMPVAAGTVPVAIAGAKDEWVFGAEQGLVAGGRVDAAPAALLPRHAGVSSAVAETVAPTLLAGHPVVVRGADWEPLARHHGIRRTAGEAPAEGEVSLGVRLADRLDARVGDRLPAQAADRAGLLWLEVSGLHAGGLLSDEAVVAEATGRALAGLPPGQASVLRVRPATQTAFDALSAPGGVVVDDVTLEPADPVAGSLVEVRVRLANPGAAAARREVFVRLDGEAVAAIEVRLPAWAVEERTVAVVAPAGPFRVEVNPSTGGEGGAPAASLEVPQNLTTGRPWTSRLVDAQGAPVAGARLAVVRPAAPERALAEATTDAAGEADWPPLSQGSYLVTVRSGPPAAASLRVLAGGAQVEVEAAWTEPARPVPGAPMTVHAQVRNAGAAAGNATVRVLVAGQAVDHHAVELAPGASTVVTSSFLTPDAGTLVRVEDVVVLAPAAAVARDRDEGATGEELQARVARRVLGDAQRTLGGLAATALATSLAVVLLATDRTLRGRAHVAGVLHALGLDHNQVRRRAAWEGAALGAAAMLVALLAAKGLFALLASLGRPAPFGHVLPDPVTPLFALQAVAAFAAASALAAHLAAGRLLARGQDRPEPLPAVPVHEQLEGV